MLKKLYVCDRCEKAITPQQACINGHREKVWFKIGIDETAGYCHHYHRSVIMCPDCWAELEKVYQEFMEK